MKFDVTIIGAGIVGLATGFQLSKQHPGLRIGIIDKESEIASHQTGHNSGVIHSGIYYTPGGSKAINCRKGYKALIDFCKEYGVRYDLCGKVIVATRESERPLLANIFKRGQENGLEGIHMLRAEEVKEKEPYVQAVEGIWVPQAGIIDYAEVARMYLQQMQEKRSRNLFGAKSKRGRKG